MAPARKVDLGSLWAELRRRRVIRVAIFYVAGAWLVAQVADVMLEAFELEHLLRFVIAGLGIGLPIALVVSWFFDVTPQGIERTASRDRADPPVPPPRGSVAVLPLANLGGEESEYFSDGLSEEIRDQLAKTPGLQVAARTSSFAFKDQHDDVREIGRRLSVAYVLEGGVRKHAETVRVSLHLVSAADGYQVWSESFERRLDDIFALQSEIAAAVTAAVNPHLVAKRSAPATSSFDAYNQYLRGRHHFHKRTESALQRAVECFKAAIELDPSYAFAYSGLADAYSLSSAGYYGNLPTEQAIALAIPAAERALALAPELAEAHASLGLIRYNKRDLEAAEQALDAALALDPKYSMAHVWLANVLLEDGRYRDASRRVGEALKLDPLSPIVNSNAGFDALRFGDEAEAETRFAASIEIDPQFPVAYSGMARLHARRGQLDRAYEWIDRAVQMTPGRAYYLVRKGLMLLRLGELERAAAVIDAASELAPHSPEIGSAVVALAVARGDRLRLEQIAGGRTGATSSTRALAALASGDRAGARRLYETAPPNSSRALRALVDDESAWSPAHPIYLSHLRLADDPAAEADLRRLLTEIDAIGRQGVVNAESAYWAASIHAILGEPDQALARLDEAIRHGWRNSAWARHDWNLERLAADSRHRDRLAHVDAAIARLARPPA